MVMLRFLLLLYQLLYFVCLLFILPYEILRQPYGKRKKWLRDRLGFIDVAGSSKPWIWIHAVSVGETLAAKELIEELSKKYHILLSTITHTGQNIALKFIEQKRVFYAPFDIGCFVRNFLKRFKPVAVLVMETELWPVLLWQCYRKKIPFVLVNGRVSERSFNGYKKIRFLMKPLLGLGTLYCMQTETDAERLTNLGAPVDKVMITGNIKLDFTPPDTPPEWTSKLSHPLIVAGSTHEGEEPLIIKTFTELKKLFPSLTLLIAPRHPERFSKVEKILKGLNYGKRSTGDIEGKDIVLMDSIGELAATYAVADICIIGGSFVPVGGHNLFEAACWGKPIITGPYMKNFPLAEEFFQNSAAIKTTEEMLSDVLKKLLNDPVYRKQIGTNAKRIFQKLRGAKDKTIKALQMIL